MPSWCGCLLVMADRKESCSHVHTAQCRDTATAGETKIKSQGRFYSHVTCFKTAWDLMSQALWRRYPNPYSKHVLSEDIVSRSTSNNKLVTKRLFTKTNKAPKWVEKFVGGAGAAACVIEESIVDSVAKTFTTYTRNINFTKLVSVEEKCVYFRCPENNAWTCCHKQAWIKCNVFGVSRAVEKFGVERYRSNAKKAEQGLEDVIEKLFSLPDFTQSATSATKSASTLDL